MSSKGSFNIYRVHNIFRDKVSFIALAICAFLSYVIRNGIVLAIFCASQIIIAMLLYKRFNISKRVNKDDIGVKYVYHCLSKEKLEQVIEGKIVRLKTTTNKWHNPSTLFKDAVYFHSSLRGNSFYYNHGYRYKNIDYVLIIPVKNLSENLLIRKCDGAIADLKEYKGEAKCIPINRVNIYKKLERKERMKIVLDYMQSLQFLVSIFIPFIWYIVRLYEYLGIISYK